MFTMWWIYTNAVQIFTLIASFQFLPHYTVALKPFFEFIVLGVIPGTSFELGYISSLLIAWGVISFFLIRKLLRSQNYSLHLHHQ